MSSERHYRHYKYHWATHYWHTALLLAQHNFCYYDVTWSLSELTPDSDHNKICYKLRSNQTTATQVIMWNPKCPVRNGFLTAFHFGPSKAWFAVNVILSVLVIDSHAVKTKITWRSIHYDDVIMTMLASQITSLTVVYSIVYSGVNQRKHQSSASLAFVREIHRGPVNFPHKWPVTRKMFPFDDVSEWVSD